MKNELKHSSHSNGDIRKLETLRASVKSVHSFIANNHLILHPQMSDKNALLKLKLHLAQCHALSNEPSTAYDQYRDVYQLLLKQDSSSMYYSWFSDKERELLKHDALLSMFKIALQQKHSAKELSQLCKEVQELVHKHYNRDANDREWSARLIDTMAAVAHYRLQYSGGGDGATSADDTLRKAIEMLTVASGNPEACNDLTQVMHLIVFVVQM